MQSSAARKQLAEIDRELIEKNLRALYAARKRGDVAAWLSLYTPNVRATVISATGSHGFSGPVIGPENMRRALQAMDTELELLDLEVVDIIIDGDRAAVRRKVTMRGRGTGETRQFVTFDYMRFEDGLISEVEQFTDTHAINAARGIAGKISA
jgi:ketosteroid isomerase-like protein